MVLPRASARLQGARPAGCPLRARCGLRRAAQPAGLCRAVVVVASAAGESQHARRLFVLSTVAVPLLAPLAVLPAFAEEEEEQRLFYGAAKPPASYGAPSLWISSAAEPVLTRALSVSVPAGGVGGTDKANARYSLLLPAAFTEVATTKVQKGSQGIDCRFTGPRKAEVRVVTLRNEGVRENVSGFSLKDPESALKSITGSDFALQDALAAGELKTAVRKDGFTYDVAGPTSMALALTTTSDGRLFCIIVSAPASAWAPNEAAYKAIRDSFTTYNGPE